MTAVPNETQRNEAAERHRQILREWCDDGLITPGTLIEAEKALDAALAWERRRTERAAKLIEDWGSAIRGDWSDFDGRSAKNTMTRIAAYMRGEGDVDYDPLGFLVCRVGEFPPHWFGSGMDHDCAILTESEGSDE